MSVRTELEKRVEKERQKIAELQVQVARAEAFVQGLQEALRMLPREPTVNGLAHAGGRGVLRAGGDIAKVQELLRLSQRPLHITEILEALGKDANKANRASLTSSLARYTRRGEIFDRAGPNTFWLLEFSRQHPERTGDSINLPDFFGGETEDETSGK